MAQYPSSVKKRSFRMMEMCMLAASLSACITINIYFPAAAAEKAADKVIDEIWQSLPDAPTSPNDKPQTVPLPTPKDASGAGA